MRKRARAPVALALVAPFFAGWAGARLIRADRFQRLESALAPWLSFTPLVAAAAPPAALVALASRRPRAAAVVLASGAALGLTVAGRAVPRRQPSAHGPAVRVLTANLLRGRARADAVVALARLTGADALLLQEVTETALTRLKRAGLGELMPYAVTDPRGESPRGSAIYARHPLSEGTGMPPTRFAQPSARVALPGGRELELVCAHPHAPTPPLPRGVAVWREELATLPPPAGMIRVLAGDFNTTLDHWRLRRLLRQGYTDAAAARGKGLIPTWGPVAGLPLLAIDHVLVDRRCAVTGVAVYPLPGSDHRAVCAEFRLPA